MTLYINYIIYRGTTFRDRGISIFLILIINLYPLLCVGQALFTVGLSTNLGFTFRFIVRFSSKLNKSFSSKRTCFLIKKEISVVEKKNSRVGNWLNEEYIVIVTRDVFVDFQLSI